MLPVVETGEEWDAVGDEPVLKLSPDGRRPGRRGRGATLPPDPQSARLHTEVMRRDFLVDPADRRLTGLFDFEPAVIGDRAYDFVGVGPFVTRGAPHLMARLTASYGRAFEAAELLAYTLLHVYSDLPWYLREPDAPAGGIPDAPAGGMPTALADAWFGTA
ncbi:phosphotransferase [Kutzneria buriramensis]|uniref:phosphotransferase n=1 Tax=Streptomyces sp. NL15-2K TaxID=376149 RepID=UPI0026F122F9|nr:phosphotransferase [Kutzneria buriramensis]WKX14916.1 phosphotransferase [Kutzneria buriramensis]